ncbi:hypothetical protein Q7C36_001263 [Tachysurus vachellii]|uniref:Uncharacterized protein n=1 Tax=Tachysurus vachellii TaxID=175792 RepID=A0AA88NXH8_TACVA|nr:hypothetical protein Q7C36_001263 [Tachysurus vachellii]
MCPTLRALNTLHPEHDRKEYARHRKKSAHTRCSSLLERSPVLRTAPALEHEQEKYCVKKYLGEAPSRPQHLLERPDQHTPAQHHVPPPFINGSFRCHVCPRSRGREKRKIMCKRLQFVCQWRQRGCQSLRSPQMLKIGSLNEGLCFEEAILMERLAACFLKWLCWHEGLC